MGLKTFSISVSAAYNISMKKPFLFLTLAVLAATWSGRAAALDFSALSGPLPAAEVKTLAVPAPVPVARQICKPFLLAVSVGGVGETVIMERVCTAENEPVWALAVEVKGRRSLSVKVVSSDYPAERARIEARIKSMVIDGIQQDDADFIVMKTGPALNKALAATSGQAELLAEAKEALKTHLARP